MIKKDDWRLQGQAEYLFGVRLVRKPYTPYSESWDHDHCCFCWAEFSTVLSSETIQDGYATEDDYQWICLECFEDFKEMFHWVVKV